MDSQTRRRNQVRRIMGDVDSPSSPRQFPPSHLDVTSRLASIVEAASAELSRESIPFPSPSSSPYLNRRMPRSPPQDCARSSRRALLLNVLEEALLLTQEDDMEDM
jgi:hypothetical protein